MNTTTSAATTDGALPSLAEVAAAATLIDQTRAFLLDRFAAATRTGRLLDSRGRPCRPVEDPTVRDVAGYGHWRINGQWMSALTAAASGDETATITFEHYTDDDRGPGHVDTRVPVPVADLFADPTADPEYDDYLRLKAKFEN